VKTASTFAKLPAVGWGCAESSGREGEYCQVGFANPYMIRQGKDGYSTHLEGDTYELN
jgi:hypothetical protein